MGDSFAARLERFSMSGKFGVFAKNGMVVSSQPLATLAGVKILLNSGNAIDAAVAAAAMLGVTEPSSLGIGGDAFALFYSAKDKALKALDASGRSPYGSSLVSVAKLATDCEIEDFHFLVDMHVCYVAHMHHATWN